ncbi:MAG: pyridoxal-phosphate dependent enzyme [Chloroflexi bacterium]|nr:pyridoxal-phosphate dependent enzyme [Chloroflexota bacterium]MBV9595519.1 pyridoxal-phosphate dependent enzyme [Chloroflexota bacterium]
MLALDRIAAAAGRAAPYVAHTPVVDLGAGRKLKLECLQPTGSYKVRGFFATALALPPPKLSRGLLTVSAGNAALAAAYVAHTLGVSCRVVMFDTAPPPKLEGVRRWGATPVLLPRAELLAWMADRAWEEAPETFIHPFGDDDLMAGYGGIGLDLVEQVDDLERVFVPVGGGGLVSGVASALKRARPGIEVVGVQSEGYPLWPRALEAGGPVALTPRTIADGTTAPFDPGMFVRVQELVDRWILVSEDELRAAVRELAAAAKIVSEGAGALGYAAMKKEPERRVSVAIVSGGNIDLRLLSEILAEA